MQTKIAYYLDDDRFKNSWFWKKTKMGMCYDHWFANILAPLWISTGCTCCAFYRGVVFGIVVTGAIAWMI